MLSGVSTRTAPGYLRVDSGYPVDPRRGDMVLGPGRYAVGPTSDIMGASGLTIFAHDLRGPVDDLNGMHPVSGVLDAGHPLTIGPPPLQSGLNATPGPWVLCTQRGDAVSTGFWGMDPDVLGDRDWWLAHTHYAWELDLVLPLISRVLSVFVQGALR